MSDTYMTEQLVERIQQLAYNGRVLSEEECWEATQIVEQLSQRIPGFRDTLIQYAPGGYWWRDGDTRTIDEIVVDALQTLGYAKLGNVG
jgi:predicted transcriptional regulator